MTITKSSGEQKVSVATHFSERSPAPVERHLQVGTLVQHNRGEKHPKGAIGAIGIVTKVRTSVRFDVYACNKVFSRQRLKQWIPVEQPADEVQ